MTKQVLLTLPEASELSGIRYSLLRGAVKNGRLKTVIISKRRMVHLGAIDGLLNEVRRAGEPVTAIGGA